MKASLWALVAVAPLALTWNVAYAQEEGEAEGAAEGEGEGEGMGEGEGEGMAEGEVGAEGAEPDVDALPAGVFTKETWPTAFNDRPLTNPKGMIEIRGEVKVNLSADAVAKPFSIAPDIYYGVSDKLMVGLTHGTGLCLAGEENGCISVYNDLGIDALFSLTSKPNMEIAAHGGVLIPNIKDTLLAGLQVGVSGKWTSGKIGVFFDPKLYIGVTERDFNKELILVPVMLGFQASPKLHARVLTGLDAPLDGFGDAFRIPVGVGALFGVSNKLDVGGHFTFTNLAGKNSSADGRQLDILVNFRL